MESKNRTDERGRRGIGGSHRHYPVEGRLSTDHQLWHSEEGAQADLAQCDLQVIKAHMLSVQCLRRRAVKAMLEEM